MVSRNVFDAVLIVLVGLAFYIEFYGTRSPESRAPDAILATILDVLRGIDPVYYLVIAGVLGVAFVSYITLYLPQKHSRDTSRRS